MNCQNILKRSSRVIHLEWDQKPRPGDLRDKLPKYPRKIQPGDPPKENGCYWRRGKSPLSLEKAKISAKHKRIASRKRLKVNLKPVPLADSVGWLQDKRCCETKASCCLKGKDFFMCQLQIHFCPIYWFYVLLSCHWIILAVSWSRWTAMTEERSVTDPVSARWGRRKLEKVIHIRWSTCTGALLD